MLNLNPSSTIDYVNIGSNYREMEKTEKVIKYYKLTLELDPTIDFAGHNIETLPGNNYPAS